MKGDYVLLSSVALAMVVVPLTALLWAGQPLTIEAVGTQPPTSAISTSQPGSSQPESKPSSQANSESDSPGSQQSSSPQGNSQKPAETVYKTDITHFRILNEATGKVEEVAVEDFVLMAMASEMPAQFHMEALKAQGVAALSYAMYQANTQRANPDPALKGADFSADPENRQVYMTEEVAREFYGDDFDYSWARLTEAADEVCNQVMLYDGEPIAAAYHAISNGITETAENIWDGPLPYLTNADSQWDILASGYKSTATFTKAEMKELLTGAGVTLPFETAGWLEITGRTPAGYVATVQVGDQEMTGQQLRKILGLRSADFEMIPSGENFVFEVKGYGHGAGLSQNGADYLGRQGKSYRDILAHYYASITLAELEN